MSTDKPIRIAVETTFLHDQYFRRGIGRYGIEMAKRYIALAGNTAEVHLLGFGDLPGTLNLLGFKENESEKLTAQAGLYFHSMGEPRLSRPARNLLDHFFTLRPVVARISPDMYIAAHFERGLPNRIAPCAVAVHDAIPLASGSFSSKGPVVNFLKGLFYRIMWQGVKEAAIVFTPSEFSQRELLRFGLEEDQLRVIPLGISEIFRAEELTDLSGRAGSRLGVHGLLGPSGEIVPYLIYDGGLETNKRADRLLEIFSLIKHPDLRLVITGGDFISNGKAEPANERAAATLAVAETLGISNRLHPVGRISEYDLAVLTANAQAYINMSESEGFGFGPLQAMAAGTPAIISNRGSFPEISGPGALLVDPEQKDLAAASIAGMLDNSADRDRLVAAGKRHSDKYNWDNTFQRTWQEIRKLTGSRNKN